MKYNDTWNYGVENIYNRQMEVQTEKPPPKNTKISNNREVLLSTEQIRMSWGWGYSLIAREHDHRSESYKEFPFVSIDLLVLSIPKIVLWMKTPSWRTRARGSVTVSKAFLPLSRKCLAHMLSRAHDIQKHLSTSTLWQMYVLHAISPSIRQQIWMAGPMEK